MNKIEECKGLIKDIREDIFNKSSTLGARISDTEERIRELTKERDSYNKDKASDIDGYLDASTKLASAKSELESLEEYMNQMESEPMISDEEYHKWCKELKEYCSAEVTKHSTNITKLLGEVYKESESALAVINETDAMLNILQDDLHLGLDRMRDRNGNIVDGSNKQKFDKVGFIPAVYIKSKDLLRLIKGEKAYTNTNGGWSRT